MTSEDQALFLLGKLMGATELFLEETHRFTDMDDTHGKLIFIPDGKKGKSWHDAHNGLLIIRDEISKKYKMPGDK